MKKVKITKEQYTKLVKSGVIKESTNVDNSFKSAFDGKQINTLKYVPEEKIQVGSKFNLNEPLKNINEEVHKLLEYIYGLPSKKRWFI